MPLEPRFSNRAAGRERYNADYERVETCVGGFNGIRRDAGWHEDGRDPVGRWEGRGEDVGLRGR